MWFGLGLWGGAETSTNQSHLVGQKSRGPRASIQIGGRGGEGATQSVWGEAYLHFEFCFQINFRYMGLFLNNRLLNLEGGKNSTSIKSRVGAVKLTPSEGAGKYNCKFSKLFSFCKYTPLFGQRGLTRSLDYCAKQGESIHKKWERGSKIVHLRGGGIKVRLVGQKSSIATFSNFTFSLQRPWLPKCPTVSVRNLFFKKKKIHPPKMHLRSNGLKLKKKCQKKIHPAPSV